MSELESERDFISVLVARYPRLFHGEHSRVMSDCPMCWRGLVNRFFADLDGMLGDQQARDFRVDHIKEKYAGLRVYWSLGRQKTMVIDVVAPDSIVRI